MQISQSLSLRYWDVQVTFLGFAEIQNGDVQLIFSPPFNFNLKRWAIAIEVWRRRRRR